VTGAKFPREARLLTPDAFTRVLKTRPFRGKFLWIYRLDWAPAAPAGTVGSSDKHAYADATDGGNRTVETLANTYRGPQLGMMIGKRNAKTAVLRNAIKRRIREQFRLRAAQLPTRAYVVRLSAVASKADTQAIVGEWIDSMEFDIKKNFSPAQNQTGRRQ
jgi:ribonuclease P protein component